MSVLIKNATYLNEQVDVLMTKGLIAQLVPHLKNNTFHTPENITETIDATGLILFPSLIDAHVHLREPGFEWKETIATGLAAAAHGGFGAVMAMANTSPINDQPAITQQMIQTGKAAFPHGPRVYPIGAATMGLQGTELTQVQELAAAGCVAISNDGRPIADTEIFRRAMEYAADFKLILIDHCEDPTLAKGSHMNEGLNSARMGIKGQPDVGEAIQVARSILLADYLNLPVHLAHISAKRSLELIAAAKAKGVQVTAETCPHYLWLDDSATLNYNTNAKVSPPLRTPKDVAAMREAIKSGVIDIMTTDHAPHAQHEKEQPFDQAPNGFTGLDLALSLSYALVTENILTQADLIRLWHTKPAQIFNLPANHFQMGDPANCFLFDPNQSWQVNPENLHSKSHNTPWLGKTLQGKVVKHWLSGVLVVGIKA